MLYGLETVAVTQRQEAEMDVAELLRFSLAVTRMEKIRNEYIRGTAQVGRFERKHERQDWGGMDMYGGKIMGILGEGCWGWNWPERWNGGLWMRWEETWLRLNLKRWRRIQKIGSNEDGKSAVVPLDGRRRQKKITVTMATGTLSWQCASKDVWLPIWMILQGAGCGRRSQAVVVPVTSSSYQQIH